MPPISSQKQALILPHLPHATNLGFGLMMLAAIVAPRATPVLLILLLLSMAYETLRTGLGPRPSPAQMPASLAVLGFALYGLVSALWSVSLIDGLNSAGSLLGLAIVPILAIWRLPHDRDAPVRALQLALLMAVALGALYLVIELASAQWIKRFVFTNVELLRPSNAKHYQVQGEAVTAIANYDLDRNLTMLNVLLWPALLIASRFKDQLQRRAWLAGLIGLDALATLPSVHASSKVALIFGLMILGLANLRLSWARAVLIATWVSAIVLVVPVVQVAYHSLGLYQASWLPFSARARIDLWGYTADHVRDHVMLGAGAGSIRVLDDQIPQGAAPKLPGHVYEARLGPHSHNIYLQTWFELGLVGASLMLASGALLIKRLATMGARVEPYALATFTACASIAAFSYGLWQPWFIGVFSLAAIALAMAAAKPALQQDGPKDQNGGAL